MATPDGQQSARVIGYKAVRSNGFALWRSAFGGVAQWAMPGGETTMPRAICNAAQRGHIGPGLHVGPTLSVACWHAKPWAASRILLLDADEQDVLYRNDGEIRATRWRTLAVLPQYDPRDPTANSQWFRDSRAADGMHGVPHANRVQFWAWLLGGALAMCWPDFDLQALCRAALLHDIGRVNDGPDPGHGARAAERVPGLFGGSGTVDIAKVAYLCHWHEPGHTANPPEWIPELLALQDADALDLWRCTTPDPARYHTDAARALYEYARDYARTDVCPFPDLEYAAYTATRATLEPAVW